MQATEAAYQEDDAVKAQIWYEHNDARYELWRQESEKRKREQQQLQTQVLHAMRQAHARKVKCYVCLTLLIGHEKPATCCSADVTPQHQHLVMCQPTRGEYAVMPITCCKHMLVTQLDAFNHVQSHQQMNIHYLLHAMLCLAF